MLMSKNASFIIIAIVMYGFSSPAFSYSATFSATCQYDKNMAYLEQGSKGAFYVLTGVTGKGDSCLEIFSESAQDACDAVVEFLNTRYSDVIRVGPAKVTPEVIYSRGYCMAECWELISGQWSWNGDQNVAYILKIRDPKINNNTITLSGGTSVEPWHKKFDIAHTKTNLTYTATVKDSSGNASPNIPVTITTEVTQDSGGHVHIDGRPKGRLVATPAGTPTPVSTLSGKDTINGNTDSNGVFTFTFSSEEASGTHTITAKCDSGKCKDSATATVKVEIQGLSLLDRDPLSYTLNGEKSWHPGSHYFSAAAMTKIINLAFAISHDPNFNKQLLIINDSSLIKGGVLDLGLDWTYTPNGHQGHRIGVVVDINNFSGPNPQFEDLASTFGIDAKWHKKGTAPHYHLWLLGKDQ